VQLQSLSATGATQINSTNWAAVKATTNDWVTLEAALSPNTDGAASLLSWSGGEAVAGHPRQRKVSKAISAKTTVTASCCNTSLSDTVWILWATVTVKHDNSKTSYDAATDTGDQAGFPAYAGADELGPVNLLTNPTPYLGWKVEIKGQITPVGVHQVITSGWVFYQSLTYVDFLNGTNSPSASGANAPDAVFNSYGSDLEDKTPDSNENIFALDGPGIAGSFTLYKSTDNFDVWVRWNGQVASDPAHWWIRQKAEWQGSGFNVLENSGGNGTTTIDNSY